MAGVRANGIQVGFGCDGERCSGFFGRLSNGIKEAKAMWNTRPKLVTSCWECNSYYEDGACSQRQTWERLKAIEDIFGDEYNLDSLRELIQADRDGRRVVHGKWIDCDWMHQCSICRCQINKRLFKSNMNYCPSCGAKMNEED